MSATPTPTPPTARAVSEVLEAAADRISQPGTWTQGTFARDDDGLPVTSIRRATCFCVLGAIAAAGGSDHTWEYVPETRRWLCEVTNRFSVSAWNDAPERTQAEVVAALRSAATLARETEARS